jgi:hypothetical protein
MTPEKFLEIFEDEEEGGSLLGKLNDDNAFVGLSLIRKYLPTKGIEGAGHDIIYSVDIDELINAEITEKDVHTLNKLNWTITDGYLACFV